MLSLACRSFRCSLSAASARTYALRTRARTQNSAPSSGCLSFRFEPLVMSALTDISTSWILLSYRQLFITSSPDTTPVVLSTHGRLTLVVNRTCGGTFG